MNQQDFFILDVSNIFAQSARRRVWMHALKGRKVSIFRCSHGVTATVYPLSLS